MTITKIKRVGATNRYNVYVDEKWCGIFLDETLARYHLKCEQEIEEDELKKIKEENDQKVAFDMAVSYLEKYVVSQKGIKDYLKKKAIAADVIDQTVEKLKEYGFVDDEKFAKNYFESLSGSKGKRVIANKLRQKGVSAEIVENLIAEIDDENEIEKAAALAKKFVKNRQNDTKCKQKCIAHLIYKGYDYSVAQQAATIALGDMGEEDDWL